MEDTARDSFSLEGLTFVYAKQSFDRVALPKYDKIGEKRGDEILKKRLADPQKREEKTVVLEKIDGSHFSIYLKRLVKEADNERFAFCYASGSKLLDSEDSVLFGDKLFYRPFLAKGVKLLEKVERRQERETENETRKVENEQAEAKETQEGRELVDFIALYCEVYGDKVMKRVDYGIEVVDLVSYALYVRDKRGKKLSGFLEYKDCRQLYMKEVNESGVHFPFLLPLFEGTFAEAFEFSEQNRNRVIGKRSTQIEGHMLTMLEGNLRLKHKSDEFIRLEEKPVKENKRESEKEKESELLKYMTSGTYYSVISRLGNDFAVDSPTAKKNRFALKKAMAEDAYGTWQEETEPLESRNDESAQLKEGRQTKPDSAQKAAMPKNVLNSLLKEAEVVLVALEKDITTTKQV